MSYREPLPYHGDDSHPKEPGTRRKKIAGYLKAANEIRQSYTANWNSRDASAQQFAAHDMPGAFPDAAVVRGGDEEMIIFPSYARKHIKAKPRAHPGTIQEVAGTGRDSRDSAGAGDAEFWKQQWEQYENDRAVVDVDVRGWLYNPHKGPLSRKHRLMVGLARQLVGLPAPSNMSSPSSSRPGSRSSSPQRDRSSRRDEDFVAQQAEEIVRKGESEADIAGRGGFSERPSKDSDGNSIYNAHSRSSSPVPRLREASTMDSLTMTKANASANDSDADIITAVQKRSSWPTPAKMSPAELSVANNHLMARLKPFMANPIVNTPISVFFYNDRVSRQRTVNTDSSGHFHLRAALDFVPTHVRVLASEKLSSTEEVHITSSRGVSLVTDIDDTIKHSAISSGAREIFRNAFIRDLSDLTIEGVKEWYNNLVDMDVKVHYVSNSPWQLYPVITSFCKMAGLPRGSYHLKQYTGMLQGIFEPVAERKKATLDRIMRDFPERRFILVGDSGEADLEVYTDVVHEYPGRVLGIFIRDVTTPATKGFFDPSMGPLSGVGNSFPGSGARRPKPSRNASTESLTTAKQFSRPEDIQDDEDELRKAISASLKDMEEETARTRRSIFMDNYVPESFPESDEKHHRPQLPPRRPTDPPAPQPSVLEGNLIDFSDDEGPLAPPQAPAFKPQYTEPASMVGFGSVQANPPSRKPSPTPPVKPTRLRSPSPSHATPFAPPTQSIDTSLAKPPPPKPRKPSTTVNTMVPSPLSQNSPLVTSPPALPKRSTNLATAKKKLSSAYNILPSPSNFLANNGTTSRPASIMTIDDVGPNLAPPARAMSTFSTKSNESLKSTRSPTKPPAPPRRNLTAYPAAAAQFASNRISGTWGGSASENAGNGGMGDAGYGNASLTAPINKKEEMWKRRWARAKEIMDRKGVVLRAWRVGTDVSDECEQLVRKALKEMENRDRDDLAGDY